MRWTGFTSELFHMQEIDIIDKKNKNIEHEEKNSSKEILDSTSTTVSPEIGHSISAPSDKKEEDKKTMPSLTNRPCYITLDEALVEKGKTFQPGVWYCDAKTVGRGEEAKLVGEERWICTPLHVDAITRTSSDGSYGRLLRIQSTLGIWKKWSMPMFLLADDGSQLRKTLLSMGVTFNNKEKSRLSSYLQEVRPEKSLFCVSKIGWSDKNHNAFVLPDAVIGPRSADVIYQNDSMHGEEYSPGGTLAGWQAGISTPAIDNPMLVLALCTAFAGPLLSLLNAENGGLHFVGPSSIGKTTFLAAACSVWGHPKRYQRTWRTTSNGAEGVASMFNDSLLALDEIKQANPTEVGDVIYMLGNGLGKQRADKNGAARAIAQWRCFVISTGEHSIETSMGIAGHRIQAGQTVRLIDVMAERRKGYGAWDNLHGKSDAQQCSDSIKAAAYEHHGHPGRVFVERLGEDTTNLVEMLEGIRRLPGFVRNGDGQLQRVVAHFALLALAGELATLYGITGWPQGEASKAAITGLDNWCENRMTSDGTNIETSQVVEAVTSFIEKHGSSRFVNLDCRNEVVVRERAGYYRRTENGPVYMFNSAGMKEALKGFDFNRAMNSLQAAGLIGPLGADGKRARVRRLDGATCRVYDVWPDGVPDSEKK